MLALLLTLVGLSFPALGVEGRTAPDAPGVAVVKVEPGTPAADAGLKPGDVIVKAAAYDPDAPGLSAVPWRDATPEALARWPEPGCPRHELLVLTGGGKGGAAVRLFLAFPPAD